MHFYIFLKKFVVASVLGKHENRCTLTFFQKWLVFKGGREAKCKKVTSLKKLDAISINVNQNFETSFN